MFLPTKGSVTECLLYLESCTNHSWFFQGENADERVKAAREAVVSGGNIKQFIEKDLAAKQHYLAVTKVKSSSLYSPLYRFTCNIPWIQKVWQGFNLHWGSKY